MKYQVGQRVTGIINNISDLGIFVTLSHHQTGLIHHSDFNNNWLREKNNYHVGEQIRVVVLHNYIGKIALSRMRVNDPDLIDHTNPFSDTKMADFTKTLTQTVNDAQKEIKKLEQDLVSYAD